MDHIQHKFVEIGGLDLYVAELGPIRYDTDLLCAAATATVIVFLHGFPEIWYSWRHHILYDRTSANIRKQLQCQQEPGL
ncbi:hypothetical protein FRX31_033899 [Thalictrum thalictroides]|uniref:Uncharacterized protein n=1 Tax=Thalictrum thalictroides TaxID=46969 RepID=A0A7J6UV88_THATH|nr:hypothetical protein FRX31_033899 [Thalictrum thalictroides]